MLIHLASTFRSPFFPALLFFPIITPPPPFMESVSDGNEVYQVLGWVGEMVDGGGITRV